MSRILLYGLLFTLFWTTWAQARFKVPSLRQPVTDSGGMLSSSTENLINKTLRQLNDQGGSQIAVLTVPTLHGLTIEQASIQVTDQWKLGTANQDNGVLIMMAKKERRVRIEVGQGLEGTLTDYTSKQIIEDVMVPLFKTGDMDSGLLLGVVQVIKRTDPQFPVEQILNSSKRSWRPSARKKQSFNFWTFLIAVIFYFLFGGMNRFSRFGRRRGWYSTSGFGGGGFSGGGFGGGGGGFSGGGASGGW